MREIRYRARRVEDGGYSRKGRGCRSQVYFPPRRRLIARQRRHVNDGNDGIGEAKANGCIQRTKALLCSRHVIDGEWVHGVFPPRRRGKRDYRRTHRGRCTRCDAAHRQGCTPDLVGAFIANLREDSFARRKRVIYVARRLTFTVLYIRRVDGIFLAFRHL